MGMIDRYKKKGGFVQLLSLMETCGKDKQEKFFKMIEEEDLTWAKAVKSKMLSINRIFNWDDNSIAEIVGTLNDLTVAVASTAVDAKGKEKIFKMMDNARKRKIDFILSEKQPNAAEVSSIYMQILTEVRKMIQEGYIRLEKIDPEIHIPSSFEEKLLAGLLLFDQDPKDAVRVQAAASTGANDGAVARELDAMKRKVVQLSTENDSLKDRLRAAEDKLEQIKKIA